MAEHTRVPLTIRLRPEDKEALSVAAEEVGIEPGLAARTAVELMVKRLKNGGTFFQTIRELEEALGQLDRLKTTQESFAAIVDRLTKLEAVAGTSKKTAS